MTLPNEGEWIRAFHSKFNKLDKSELAPHANLLFGEVFQIHELKGRAVFVCRNHSKNYKWHSFRARMSFKYELIKEGNQNAEEGK